MFFFILGILSVCALCTEKKKNSKLVMALTCMQIASWWQRLLRKAEVFLFIEIRALLDVIINGIFFLVFFVCRRVLILHQVARCSFAEFLVSRFLFPAHYMHSPLSSPKINRTHSIHRLFFSGFWLNWWKDSLWFTPFHPLTTFFAWWIEREFFTLFFTSCA